MGPAPWEPARQGRTCLGYSYPTSAPLTGCCQGGWKGFNSPALPTCPRVRRYRLLGPETSPQAWMEPWVLRTGNRDEQHTVKGLVPGLGRAPISLRIRPKLLPTPPGLSPPTSLSPCTPSPTWCVSFHLPASLHTQPQLHFLLQCPRDTLLFPLAGVYHPAGLHIPRNSAV